MKMTEVELPLPVYCLKEKDEEIIIVILAPLAKPKEVAFVLEDDVFTFESNPYLLKIKLPHPVSDKCKELVYDSESWTYNIRLRKISATYDSDSDVEKNEDVNGTADNLDPHKPPSSGWPSSKLKCYGFANRCSDMFGKFQSEFSEVVDLPNPDNTDVKERRRLRLKEESEKWNDDHYLADLMETEHLESIFAYKPPWAGVKDEVELTEDEKNILDEIRKNAMKIDKLSKPERRLAEFQIIDVLFAYAYNRRTTEGENTVESGWTINKLSSTLCWLEEFESLKAVLLSCFTRSLIYPLYRNWNLSEMVHKDVVDILKLGSNAVARCLIEVIEIFNDSENRYLLNTLYLNNLCLHALKIKRKHLTVLALQLERLQVTKYEVNHDLPVLEIAAHITLEEERGERESEVSNIVDEMRELVLGTESDSNESDSERTELDSSQSSDKEN